MFSFKKAQVINTLPEEVNLAEDIKEKKEDPTQGFDLASYLPHDHPLLPVLKVVLGEKGEMGATNAPLKKRKRPPRA